MSPAASAGTRSRKGFPRVSGDEPVDVDVAASVATFSPRERG